MRKIFSILIILIFAKQSYALDCLACEATDTEDTCELSYKCPKGSKYCETLVSKVEGSYSVVMSCATEEKCKAEAILEDGLDECNHDEDNTECYSCCKGDDCNTLDAALKKLPDDIFETEKPTKKGKKNKGKKEDDDDDEEEEKIDEKKEDNDDEEDKDVKTKKEEKKKSKSKGNDKKSKTKEEDPEKEEKTDDENSEEPEEEKSDKNEQDDKKVKNSVPSSNETNSEVNNESPENGTVVEKTILNDNNQTVVATNITANATEEGIGNNNNTEEVNEPLDPNIQEIDKTLNENVDVVEELINNLDNAGNAENVENNGFDLVEPKKVAENSTNSNFGLEETKVEDGTLFKTAEDEEETGFGETNNDPNIINQGENADEIGDQHGLYDAPSSSTKYQISEILILATSIIILVQFF